MARYVQSNTPMGPKWGLVDGDEVVLLESAPWETPRAKPDAPRVGLSSLTLLPPTGSRPAVVCAARNYRAHAAELNNAVPEQPLVFLKPASSLIAAGDCVALPLRHSRLIHHEGELAVIIGDTARDIRPEDTDRVIFGYTLFNDITARDIQRHEGKFTRAKGFDTFAPIGPWVDTSFRPEAQRIAVHVNGDERQSGQLDEMIFSIAELISVVSGFMTLHPGDVIATGTPSGVGPLSVGDVVTVNIEGLGTLANPVIERPYHD